MIYQQSIGITKVLHACTSSYTLMLCFCLTLIGSSCHTQKSLTQTTTTTKTNSAPNPILKDKNYLIKGSYKMMRVDKLGFIYLVNNQNGILKYDKNGQLLFRYSINRLGTIQDMDVQNPQKIFVYYPDFSTILYLDNTLSEMKRITLETLDLWDMQGATATRANNIWLYDNAQIRLLQINEQGTIAASTNERSQELIPYQSTFKNLRARNNKIYVCGSEGLDVFDEFGIWTNHYTIYGQHIQIEADRIFYLQDNKIHSYTTGIEFKSPNKIIFELDNPATSFHLTNDHLILKDKGGIWVKKIGE